METNTKNALIWVYKNILTVISIILIFIAIIMLGAHITDYDNDQDIIYSKLTSIENKEAINSALIRDTIVEVQNIIRK